MTAIIYATGGNMSDKKQIAYFYNARPTEDESQVDMDGNLKGRRLAAWNQWFMYLAGKMQRIGDEAPVNREYDLFEKLPDGSTVWREMVVGRENACTKAHTFAKLSSNEFFAIHPVTKEIVARENIAGR
jgi:hypothetical protein